MLNEQLPQCVDATRLSQQQAKLSGHHLLSDLPRLAEMLMQPAGEQVLFSFAFDQWAEDRVVSSEIEAKVPLKCERCGSRFLYHLKAKTDFGVVKDALSLPAEGLEPLVEAEGQVDLWALLEEEVVLNIPYIPKHPEGSCAPGLVKAMPLPEEGVQKERPFEKLAALLESRALIIP